MKNIKGLIFDLDGVIVHTDEYHYQAWKQLADKKGIPFDREDNNRLRGVSRMESLEIILEKSSKTFTQEEKEQMAHEKNELYKKSLAKLTKTDVAEDVIETLEYFKNEGYKLVIGSSSKNTMMILKNIWLLEMFDAVSDGNNITYSKPNPEVFLKAAEFVKLEIEECVVIEDARSGVDAALAGGFKCFGIGDAYDYEKTTWKIKSLAEMKNILHS